MHPALEEGQPFEDIRYAVSKVGALEQSKRGVYRFFRDLKNVTPRDIFFGLNLSDREEGRVLDFLSSVGYGLEGEVPVPKTAKENVEIFAPMNANDKPMIKPDPDGKVSIDLESCVSCTFDTISELREMHANIDWNKLRSVGEGFAPPSMPSRPPEKRPSVEVIQSGNVFTIVPRAPRIIL
ncbi:MAG TPA: hypothetical protein VFR09_07040 [Alphaproteobacteria bacterium]|nr:hypothetical protein [Alphaproteobacteria bacterium]